MMHEAQNWPIIQRPQSGEPCVGPSPIGRSCAWLHLLPQQWITKGLDAQAGEQVQIALARDVAALYELVAIFVADTAYGAFEPAPEFDGGLNFGKHVSSRVNANPGGDSL